MKQSGKSLHNNYLYGISLIIVSLLIIRFVDGEDYMSAVADAIMGAKREVYITDWQYVLI